MILINAAIIGGAVLFVAGAVTNNNPYIYAGIILIVGAAIYLGLIQLIEKIRVAKTVTKEVFHETKKAMSTMKKKERIRFVLLTVLIVGVWISIIIFSIIGRITGNYTAMFICLGIFLAIGPVCILINRIRRR